MYLQLNNAKANEKILLESVQRLQEANESVQSELEKLQQNAGILENKLKEYQTQLLDLQEKNKKLEKEKKDLQIKLEAKRKMEQERLLAAGQNSPAAPTTSIPNSTFKGPKTAYLTFDDGPSKNTISILNTLQQENVKGTFFVNGKTDGTSLSLYKRIVNEGHTLANHTYSHNYSYIYKNTDNFMADVEKLNQHLLKTTGVAPKVFRFPGGSNNTVSYKYGGKGLTKELAGELTRKGYTYIDWNVDSTDASVSVQSKEKIVQTVLQNSKNKQHAVILMHDSKVKTTTAQALPEIIRGLKEMGFRFEALGTDTYRTRFINP